MRTILNKPCWKILDVFYNNKNTPIHLRELSRIIDLKEGALSRHLNKLEKEKILTFQTEGNLKKFKINKTQLSKIYTFLDMEKYDDIPFIRKNSINCYINNLKHKPVIIILFGSTAKKTFKQNSDIDLISIFNEKTDSSKARKYAESQTGIKISEFQLTHEQFIKEIKLKEDNVIQAGIETGYPIYNHTYYYKVINNESEKS